ncbi:hypothetical protein QC764_0068770 [Podospora pseudoanserina]|uniref:Uncharacterized protein n=1 Tax=Podospora pseudoanserina TaxID=2609844 RepID=A0ABR0IAT7_9PEZI|nr:hypothetical protein QC764_0068770 [Podospora pseudoanserina]
MSHQRPRANRARRQHQNFITRHDLLPGEFLTEVALLTRNGHVVMLPRALISPCYQQSYIPAATEEIWDGATQQLTAEEASFSTVRYSPMGLLSSNRSPRTWYKIPQMSPQWTIMRFPILDSELCRQKGVSTIPGRPFIIWRRQFLSRLLTPRTPYVFDGSNTAAMGDQGQNADIQSGMGRMPSVFTHGGVDSDNQVRMERTPSVVEQGGFDLNGQTEIRSVYFRLSTPRELL